MRLRPSRERGFGLVMVMAAVVSLGILAIVFIQKISNQANLSKLAVSMSYRDAVLNYYFGVAANRHSYECTKQNVTALKNYVEGISISLGQQALSIYDVASPCAVLIPSTGLGFNLGDEYPVANPSSSPCSGRAFCLQPEVKATGNGNEVEVILTISFEPDIIKGVGMKMKDVSRQLWFNRTIQKNCATTLGQKAVIEAAFDKKDKVNEGIVCSPHTLIQPPLSGGSHVAKCPLTSGGGQTGVVGFNSVTGLTRCGGPDHIVLNPTNVTDCNSTGDGILGVDGAGNVICSSGRNRYGAVAGGCSTHQAITGIDASGITGCRNISPGDPGPRGRDGIQLRWYEHRCQYNSSGGSPSNIHCHQDSDCLDSSCGTILYDGKCADGNYCKTGNPSCTGCHNGTCQNGGGSCSSDSDCTGSCGSKTCRGTITSCSSSSSSDCNSYYCSSGKCSQDSSISCSSDSDCRICSSTCQKGGGSCSTDSDCTLPPGNCPALPSGQHVKHCHGWSNVICQSDSDCVNTCGGQYYCPNSPTCYSGGFLPL